MRTPERGPAASGARLLGDDYQHLLTWLHAAQLVHRDPQVTRVELEKHGAGNIDDLVVHRRDRPALYHQVKFTTQPGRPLTGDWFTEAPSGDSTPLQRFHDSYTKLTVDGTAPEMVLHTNRLPAASDPILECLDGTTELLVPKLALASPRSAAGRARSGWASHLGIDEDQLLTMLGSLRIRAAQASINALQEHCRWVMDAVGMSATAECVDKGMLAARRWVQTGVRDIDGETIGHLIEEQQLSSPIPRATVLIQAIEHDLWPETATVALDWVDAFNGERPSERRESTTPDVWMSRFAPELQQAASQVRGEGFRHVRIDGAFRLATAIYAGTVFSDVKGFQVAVPGRSGDGTWTGDISSDGPRSTQNVTRTNHELAQGAELAVGLNVSGDLTSAVLKHAQAASLPLNRLVVLSVPNPGRDALGDPADVLGWTQAVTHELRHSPRRATLDYISSCTARAPLRFCSATPGIGCRPHSSGTTSVPDGATRRRSRSPQPEGQQQQPSTTCLSCAKPRASSKKVFQNDGSLRQQRIEQASVRKARWMSGSRS